MQYHLIYAQLPPIPLSFALYLADDNGSVWMLDGNTIYDFPLIINNYIFYCEWILSAEPNGSVWKKFARVLYIPMVDISYTPYIQVGTLCTNSAIDPQFLPRTLLNQFSCDSDMQRFARKLILDNKEFLVSQYGTNGQILIDCLSPAARVPEPILMMPAPVMPQAPAANTEVKQAVVRQDTILNEAEQQKAAPQPLIENKAVAEETKVNDIIKENVVQEAPAATKEQDTEISQPITYSLVVNQKSPTNKTTIEESEHNAIDPELIVNNTTEKEPTISSPTIYASVIIKKQPVNKITTNNQFNVLYNDQTSSESEEENSVKEEPVQKPILSNTKKSKPAKKASDSLTDIASKNLRWSYQKLCEYKNIVKEYWTQMPAVNRNKLYMAANIIALNWTILAKAEEYNYINREELYMYPRARMTPEGLGTMAIMALCSTAALFANKKLTNKSS